MFGLRFDFIFALWFFPGGGGERLVIWGVEWKRKVGETERTNHIRLLRCAVRMFVLYLGELKVSGGYHSSFLFYFSFSKGLGWTRGKKMLIARCGRDGSGGGSEVEL